MPGPLPGWYYGIVSFNRQRPALRPGRFFHAFSRACALALVTATAACATPSSVEVNPEPPAKATHLRIIDERGPLDPGKAAGTARRLERKGDTDLLGHHLSHVENAVRAPLALGNEARLLIDGPQTHSAMFEAIAKAHTSINLETYILEAEEAGARLAEMLKAKRAQGVAVNVLYDSVGSLGTSQEYFQQLTAAGVAVCEFNPVNPLKAQGDVDLQINNRDHRKILIVDGRTAFTGGINISTVYRSGSFGKRHKPTPKEGWRDTHVQVAGPVVLEFQRLFLHTWKSQNCPPVADADYFPPQERQGDKPMRLVAADPGNRQSEPYVVLLSAINNASRRIWLTYGYFVPDERMLQALGAAARRGVDVRLVLPGFSDFWAPFHAGRSHYTQLLSDGVRILERRDALLHAKTAVIDGVWSSVGSTNLDWRSFVHNYEADLLVLDPGFAHQMEELFQLDEDAAHPVGLAEWRQRGPTLRIKEWVARWWEYFL